MKKPYTLDDVSPELNPAIKKMGLRKSDLRFIVSILNVAFNSGYDKAEADMRARAEPLLKKFGI